MLSDGPTNKLEYLSLESFSVIIECKAGANQSGVPYGASDYEQGPCHTAFIRVGQKHLPMTSLFERNIEGAENCFRTSIVPILNHFDNIVTEALMPILFYTCYLHCVIS